jgi:hypothetical protein
MSEQHLQYSMYEYMPTYMCFAWRFLYVKQNNVRKTSAVYLKRLKLTRFDIFTRQRKVRESRVWVSLQRILPLCVVDLYPDLCANYHCCGSGSRPLWKLPALLIRFPTSVQKLPVCGSGSRPLCKLPVLWIRIPTSLQITSVVDPDPDHCANCQCCGSGSRPLCKLPVLWIRIPTSVHSSSLQKENEIS